MKPSVGRIVHYVDHELVLSGIVVAIWLDDETRVDLTVFLVGGGLSYASHVPHESDSDGVTFWRWPPRVE